MSDVKHYSAKDAELKWGQFWEASGVHNYDPSTAREQTYVIDSPPPTVSGSLHIGHVFSYTQTDILARYKRMNGFNVFYPMGWDDNGLPTERRVQNLFGITCNPELAYDQHWAPAPAPAVDNPKLRTPVSRQNFLEACTQQTLLDEKKYEALWRSLGLSIDWKQQYSTLNNLCRRVSQLSFLDLIEKGQIYSTEAPTLWDTGFQTAVAQADVEERPKQGSFYDLRFHTENEHFTISTTRPELLPACIAVVAHPSDDRYKALFGKTAICPLFRSPVPILASEHAQPEKGTGILMVCTFGDIHDVEFWKRSKLPLKRIIGKDGRLLEIDFGQAPFSSNDVLNANRYYALLQGLTIPQARSKIVTLLSLDESSAVPGYGPALIGEPRKTEQAVKYYEKGDFPLEFVPTRQWFIRILQHKTPLLDQGRKVEWHPSSMLKRYEQWVEGLNQDWCISRQRFFGVPFPVWYKIDSSGIVQYDQPIFAKEDCLPVDPLGAPPPGYSEAQRGKPSGFIGDPDVMDTWATSSMTPQINSQWKITPDRHKTLFPADLRPQAHEIIRTWAFYTIAKAWMHENEIPWKEIAISGWVVDPNRNKMSKSKGNIVAPESLIEKYSADGVRYWAGRAKLGQDTIFDEKIFQTGQRLTTKLYNASRFVKLQLDSSSTPLSATDIVHPLDRSWIQKMRELVDTMTKHFDDFDYAQALIECEQWFWKFCDDYIELVKARAYQQKDSPEGKSALATLEWSLKIFLRLFAPFLPYISEEVWSWRFARQAHQKSIHREPWPKAEEVLEVIPSSEDHYNLASLVLNEIRKTKSAERKNLRWPVKLVKVEAESSKEETLLAVKDDICAAGNVEHVQIVSSNSEFKVFVQLAEG